MSITFFLFIFLYITANATWKDIPSELLIRIRKYLIPGNYKNYLLLGKKPKNSIHYDLILRHISTGMFKELMNVIRQDVLINIVKRCCDIEIDRESVTSNPINIHVLFDNLGLIPNNEYAVLSRQQKENLVYKLNILSPKIFNQHSTKYHENTNTIIFNYCWAFLAPDAFFFRSACRSDRAPELPIWWIDISSVDPELLNIIFTNDVWSALTLFGNNVDYNYILRDTSPKDTLVLYNYNIEYGNNKIFPDIIVNNWLTIICVLPRVDATFDLSSIHNIRDEIIVHFSFRQHRSNAIIEHLNERDTVDYQHVTVTIIKTPGISLNVKIDDELAELVTARIVT